MLTQVNFVKELGIGNATLKKLQEQGLFLPVFKSPSGARIYYSEEQIAEYKKYIEEQNANTDGYAGLSAKEFAEATGIDRSTLREWHLSGRLKAVKVGNRGRRRYNQEQVQKYFDGEYDGVKEDGFIDRKNFADLVGVSEHTIVSWQKKGKLFPDHKSVTRIWQYRPEQVEEAKKLKR